MLQHICSRLRDLQGTTNHHAAVQSEHEACSMNFEGSTFVLHDSIQGFNDSVNCVQFDGNAQHLAVGGDDCVLTVWDLHTSPPKLTFRIGSASAVTALLWHPLIPVQLFGCNTSTDQHVSETAKVAAYSSPSTAPRSCGSMGTSSQTEHVI